MLSLVELERVVRVLNDELIGARVERWVEPGRGRLAVALYRGGDREPRKVVLGIDARPELARLSLLERLPEAPMRMPAFAAYLRAHLSRARIESARVRGDDRQLEILFSAKAGRYRLLLSIFGRRSNVYLLDEADRLLQALRPLADTRAELEPGQPWLDPGRGAPQRGEDRFEESVGLALLESIERCYAEEIGDRTSDEERRLLLNALKKERRTAAKRLERIEAELAEADEATTLQRDGELLKANLSRIEQGAESVTVEDFETGAPIEIKLDPRRSAKANLEAIFKRYQKLLRRLTKAGGQVAEAQEKVDALAALEIEARESPDPSSLLTRDEVQRILARHGARPARTSVVDKEPAPSLPSAYRNLPRKLHPRRYLSADGLEIWVGRSDEANDVLTTRLARGKDLFFHLDGAPGSHVILRTEGQENPPAESVIDACELSVHFSKQKNASRADVHVVPIRNVKKPRGAKRGLVYVTGGKSVHLRREPDRLKRLLAARIDD